MKKSDAPPIYSQVAQDIASRIACGELKENSKIAGRSLMATEYGVSPETIRRALKLLADMQIVQVIDKSGVVILSRKNAQAYIEKYSTVTGLLKLKAHLHTLVQQRDDLNRQIADVTEQIMDMCDRFRNSDPLKNVEFTLPEGSSLAGKTLGECEFRRVTGANVVAIKRGEEILLSPQAQQVLRPNDVLVVTCDITAVERIEEFIQ